MRLRPSWMTSSTSERSPWLERTFGAGCGYMNGGVELELPAAGLTLRAPDCARLRASGENERAGIAPDIPVALAGLDAAERARRVLAAAAPAAQASRGEAPR